MWAKVLAGVLAAVSVAGVGVTVGVPGKCGNCPLTGKPTSAPVVDFGGAPQPASATPDPAKTCAGPCCCDE